MTKVALKNFSAEIARKRRELTRLQQDLENLLDHLIVIEARVKSANAKRCSAADVKRALGLQMARTNA